MRTALLITLLAATAAAQPIVSIYTTPDKSPVGPWDQVPYGTVQTLYVVVENAGMMVAGTSFRLEDSGAFMRLGESYPDGVVIGDLAAGVEIGLTTPIPQFDSPAVVASFEIYVDRLSDVTYLIVPHPDEASVLVADSQAQIHQADGNSLELRSFIRPEIGIFFDDQGTALEGTFAGGEGQTATAYLMLRDLDHPADGVYLSLDLPEGIELLDMTLPTGGSVSGDMGTGAILSYSPRIPAGGTAMLATLELSTGTTLGDRMLTVDGHVDYGTVPFVYVAPSGAYTADALSTLLSIPVPNEDRSWGGVKALFR